MQRYFDPATNDGVDFKVLSGPPAYCFQILARPASPLVGAYARGPARPGQVYVYDLPAKFNSALKAKQPRCVNDQYGTEIRFHENLLASAIRTTNPDEAEFFFVPVYGECNLYLQTEL